MTDVRYDMGSIKSRRLWDENVLWRANHDMRNIKQQKLSQLKPLQAENFQPDKSLSTTIRWAEKLSSMAAAAVTKENLEFSCKYYDNFWMLCNIYLKRIVYFTMEFYFKQFT